MSIEVHCPACHATYQVPDNLAGKSVRCRECGGVFKAVEFVAPVEPDPEPRRKRWRGEDDEGSPAVEQPARGRGVLWSVLGVVAGVALLGGLVAYYLSQGGGGPEPRVAQQPPPRSPVQPQPKEKQPVEGGLLVDGKLIAAPTGFQRPADRPRRESPITVAPPEPLELRPPAFVGEQLVVPLGGPLADVAVGGGGRFLVVRLEGHAELRVFDVQAAAFVKSLPLAEERALIAAGMDRLVVVYPGTSTLERWSLKTFERDGQVPLDLKVPAVALALGCASNGPLVISGVDYPRLGETMFFDLVAMKPYSPLAIDKHRFFDSSPRVFLRASANGRTFACRPGGFSTSLQSCVVGGLDLVRRSADTGSDHPVPSAAGDCIFTSNGRWSPDLRDHLERLPPGCVPAHQGSYFVRAPRNPGDKEITVHLPDSGTEVLARVVLDKAPTYEQASGDTLNVSRHYHLIPQAKVLAVFTNSELILRRLDLDEALREARFGYLTVLAAPAGAARCGREYRGRLVVASSAGADVEIGDGPAGMKLAPNGEVTWTVPADFPDPEVVVTFHLLDRRSKLLRYRWPLQVLPPE